MFFFWGETHSLPVSELLLSAGVLLLELFCTNQQSETNDVSSQNYCKVFAEHRTDGSASCTSVCPVH